VLHLHMNGSVGRLISDTGRLVGVGTLIALILAVIGIVGVVTEGLARRTREIGVRLALGARPYQVTGALATESVLTSLAGLGVGLVVVVTLHEVMASVFFNYFVNELGSSVLDPKVLAAAVAVVLSATLAASFGTARRALSVDPMEALRTD
jgi:ABC-type antimicrobial peptide transport system permease subunit